MNGKIACVIPSAGWGTVCPDRSIPKVLADVGGQTMISRVIQTVREASLNGSVIVVIGENGFGTQIRQALSPLAYPDLKFVIQPERRGAADAVAWALSLLNGEEHVLVTFGDMPLWRAATFRRLADAHLAGRSVISMVTVALQAGHQTAKYGRIVKDDAGRILAAFEPSEMSGIDLSRAKSVNPSLYLFERQWLADNLGRIKPMDKGDGFPPEIHLPKLLPIAHDQGVRITEVHLEDPSEALGVNTAVDLHEVVTTLQARMRVQAFA